ncbi:MAG: hypothetical protein Q4D57_04355 [Clostridia bacterium]|nr:hypothetical protein [Clostridia bacterium]
MATLVFVQEKHQYFLDNSLIPSVSEILKPIHDKIYGKINAKTLKKASERGTKIHRAIEFMSKYKLSKFDGEISGYIGAYKKFRGDYPTWQLLHSEYRTYHKSLLYGMTIDEVYKTEEGIVLLDIKTTNEKYLNSWSVQLSAYKSGYESQHEKVIKTYILKLNKDGEYQFFELSDNFSVFLSCLEIYRFGE